MALVQAEDGVRISYQTIGDGPLAIVFMHGWAGSGEYFDSMLDNLDLSGLRAITFDLRGHGDSDKPRYGYTDEQLARDVLAVADATATHQFVILGFSMSGRFAQYVTYLAPERVRGQMLVAGCPASPLSFPEETLKDWVARAGDSDKLLQVATMFMSKKPAPDILERLGRQAAKASGTALKETLNVVRSADFSARIKSLSTPTLVVAGSDDSLFSPEQLRESVMKPLVHARLVVLDCSHEIPIEEPRELSRLVEAFIAGLW